MYIRTEKTKTEVVLVIDEIGRYLGSASEEELFIECINIDLEPLIEDDYIFFFVDKDCLMNLLKK
jgi:hypothetical protein